MRHDSLHSVGCLKSWSWSSPPSVALSSGLSSARDDPWVVQTRRAARLLWSRTAEFIRAAGDLGTGLRCELLSISKMSAAALLVSQMRNYKKGTGKGGREEAEIREGPVTFCRKASLLATWISVTQRLPQELAWDLAEDCHCSLVYKGRVFIRLFGFFLCTEPQEPCRALQHSSSQVWPWTLIRRSILQKGYKAFRVFFKKIMVHFLRFNIISFEGKYGESSLKMHLRTPHLSSEYEYIYISCNQGWFDKVRIASLVDLDFTLTRLRLQSLLPILSVLHVYFTSFLHH